MRLRKLIPVTVAALFAIGGLLVAQTGSDPILKRNTNRKPRMAELSQAQVNYIRPGAVVKIVSAGIAKDGTITARVNITDPKGVPLDRLGVATPGPVSMSFICAYIPAGQKEYTSYSTTTLKATINNNPAQVQAANDSGGTITENAIGDYTYTFKTKAPVTFEAASTHTIGVSVNHNLTEFMEYDEWSAVANDTFNFVPDGSKVKTIRSVVPTAACNQCHDPLFGHGGSRKTVELCILCHSPQTINPDTLESQDMPVLIHKIHMGKNLPSVKAGTPYRIWHRGAWSDFSEVGFPSGVDELKTCTVCHKDAPQADQYKTNPTRAACGACHDDVDFASGKNHVNLPQVSDSHCTDCHKPIGETEYDSSVVGAHMVATRSSQMSGMVFEIVRVDNAKAGQKPTVVFTIKDKKGNLVDITKVDRLAIVLTGPTTDYDGMISEDPRKTTTISGGLYNYTFAAALPATAKGSYAVSLEGYKNVTVNPGTVNAVTARDLGNNKVFQFSVDASKVSPRRQIVSEAKCTTCHERLFFHGGNRQTLDSCLQCHNPTANDSSQRAANDVPESINFKTMIHKIHTGKELTKDFTVMGYGKSTNNYNDVGYVGDRRNCDACHLPNTYNLPLSEGQITQVAPRDYITQMQPVAAACLSCHTSKPAAAHALINTSATLGESCEACHGVNSEASVVNVHKR